MANHCINDVIFSGSEKDIQRLEQVMLKMQADETSSGLAQSPDFFSNPAQSEFYSLKPRRYGQDYCVSYITNYLPNVQDILWIATEFSLSFIMDAVEHGMGIYQASRFKPGQSLIIAHMEPAEIAAIDYDPVTLEAIFQQQRFTDMGACVRSILDAKLDLLEQNRWQS